jgi:hypothetical protein
MGSSRNRVTPLLTWRLITFILSAATPSVIQAQLVPEIGYVLPAGAGVGTTVDMVIGGYDWTPDMQLFVHDPRIKLEIVGKPTDVLVAEPPYWFGYKARGYAWPLSREFTAKLIVPADVAPGLIRWQVANANGASPVGQLHIGSMPEVAEIPQNKTSQELPALPITVSGQIRRIEEIDRYQFSVPTAGPVTIEILARRIGSPLHAMLKVKDPTGRAALDVADTEGRDFTVTMHADAGVPYELSVHDLDFGGDRSYVYRLMLTAAPHATAAYPAAGPRGQTKTVEFVGIGLATGGQQLESVTHEVAFPADPETTFVDYPIQTPWGVTKPVKLLVSDLTENVEPIAGEAAFMAPVAVTGAIESRFGSDQYSVTMTKGQPYVIAAAARAIGSPLDLDLTVFGPDGKQVASNDDAAGSVDPELVMTPAADGIYKIVVTDRSGKGGNRAANYRLSVAIPWEDVELTLPPQLNVVLGTQVKLTVKATRKGGFKGPIPITIKGLPPGITLPDNLVIAEDKAELAIDLTCAADAAVSAALCSISTTLQIGDRVVTRLATPTLVAITMKPRIKLTPEGLDDVRKVHRGSTYLFPMLIERLEGYAGPINLEMTAKQQRHRQGLASDEFIVPADAKRVEYPIFVPEWMETTKTSRMILNGSVQVADPKGTMRTLLQRQELRFGILPEGALMKLTHAAGEMKVSPGAELSVPISLSIAPELRDPIQISVISGQGLFTSESVALAVGQKQATINVRVADLPAAIGEQELVLRATALRDGLWPVVSETNVLVTIQAKQ